jgi:hypothetical protein
MIASLLMSCCAAIPWSAAEGHANHPALVPAPAQVGWADAPPLRLTEGQVAIVLGEKATQPEQSASDLLRRNVQKRFGQD